MEMNALDLLNNAYNYNDIETNDPAIEADTLGYRDGIVEHLQDNIEAFLEFGTARQLIKIVADAL